MQKMGYSRSRGEASGAFRQVLTCFLFLSLTSCSGGTRGTAITHRRTIDGVVRTAAANPRHYSTITVLETDSTTEVDETGRFALFVDAPVTELNLTLSDGSDTENIITLPSLSPSDSSLILVLNPDNQLDQNSLIETTTKLIGDCAGYSTSVPEVQQQPSSESCHIEVTIQNESSSFVSLSIMTKSCVGVSESSSTEEILEIAPSQSRVQIIPLNSDSQVEAQVRLDELQQSIVRASEYAC